MANGFGERLSKRADKLVSWRDGREVFAYQLTRLPAILLSPLLTTHQPFANVDFFRPDRRNDSSISDSWSHLGET